MGEDARNYGYEAARHLLREEDPKGIKAEGEGVPFLHYIERYAMSDEFVIEILQTYAEQTEKPNPWNATPEELQELYKRIKVYDDARSRDTLIFEIPIDRPGEEVEIIRFTVPRSTFEPVQ